MSADRGCCLIAGPRAAADLGELRPPPLHPVSTSVSATADNGSAFRAAGATRDIFVPMHGNLARLRS